MRSVSAHTDQLRSQPFTIGNPMKKLALTIALIATVTFAAAGTTTCQWIGQQWVCNSY